MDILNIIKNIYYNRNWKRKRDYLRMQGAIIGTGTRLNCNTSAFGTEPYLIEVGENCLFASGIHLITHDGGVKVLSSLNYFNGKRFDKMGRIKIGNNVYIGVGARIMPDVVIGDNCIIGANAVVTKNIPSNSVAVGVPAKVIKTIGEYYRSSVESGCLYPTPLMSKDEKKWYLSKEVPRLINTKEEY